MEEVNRLSKIAVRYARRFGVKAAPCASAGSFDVMTEREPGSGLLWVKSDMRDVHRSPAKVAWHIRRSIRKAWVD